MTTEHTDRALQFAVKFEIFRILLDMDLIGYVLTGICRLERSGRARGESRQNPEIKVRRTFIDVRQ